MVFRNKRIELAYFNENQVYEEYKDLSSGMAGR